jgi:transposase-like protein
VRCPKCEKASMVIRSGIRKNLYDDKQIYKCKECGIKFTFNDRFRNKKYPPRIIMFVQNRYDMGHSIKEISNEVESNFKIYISIPTLYHWIKEYSSGPDTNSMKRDKN